MIRRLLSVCGLVAVAVASGAACKPTEEERYYINAQDFLIAERANVLPNRTTILTVTAACRKAAKDANRLRAARKLLAECDPSPEVWYYQKALAAFPAVLAGSLDKAAELKWACTAANSTLVPFPAAGTPKDRDRLPAAKSLAEECDRSLVKLKAD